LGELTVSQSVTITGPGANLLTLDADGDSRLFRIDDGATGALINVTLSGLTLSGGNVAGSGDGGAIFNRENIAILRSVISGNSAVGGGAIYSRDGSLTISQSTVSGNSATLYGGGILNLGGSLSVIDSTLSGNSAKEGGALVSDTNLTNRTTTIAGSTISGNTATVRGGGLLNLEGLTTIRHSTITNNTAPAGGGSGVASYGTELARTDVFSTLITGNTNSDVDVVAGITNSLVSLGYNLVGTGGGTSGFTMPGDTTGIRNAHLAPLANNGGPTQTHALLLFSPAVNAGDPTAVAGMNGVPAFDQRGEGFPRVGYGRIDIGAFEAPFVVGAELVVGTPTDELDNNLAPGDLSLREAIGLANLDADSQTISFAPALTNSGAAVMNLLLGELAIHAPLTVAGPGAGLLTLNADDDSRLFHVDDGVTGALVNVTLSGLTLTGGNIAGIGDGGAIFNRENLSILRSVITGNAAIGGGGIYSRDGSLTITQSTISGNSASLYGGGIHNFAGNLSVTDSTLSGNSASGGGGLVSDTNLNNRTTTITGSTISGNTANVRGGGLLNLEGLTVIRHSTITNNTAPVGGGSGVASYGTELARTEVFSTLITGNTNSGVDLVSGATNSFLSLGYNLVGAGSGAGAFTMPGDQAGVSDVQLGPLANNGGPTRTHALLLNSPAINAGDHAAMAGRGGVPTFDQRGDGFLRIAGGRIDVGAFENQKPDIVVDILADESDGNSGPGDLSLREAIALANDRSDAPVIQFATALTSGGAATLMLSLGDLAISGPVAVLGPGANLLTIDANDVSRIFRIDDGEADNLIAVQIAGLKLTDGKSATAGGAILNAENLTLNRVEITENFANLGGAVSSTGELSVVDSTLAGNTATGNGGGIHSSGKLLVSNSTISGNSATFDGGGIFNTQNEAVIRHSTITANMAQASRGGGVTSSGADAKTRIHSTIIAGNTLGDVDFFGSDVNSFSSDGYNLIGLGSAVGAFNQPGDQTGFMDPLLNPLGSNGGPTRTHALLSTSPAINAGDPTAASGMGDVPAFDQRGAGFARVQNSRIDIGAFESPFFVGITISVDTLVDELDGNIGPGDLSLREAISLANLEPDLQTIRFAPSLTSGGAATISLSLGEIVIRETVTINGPGANLLAIDAHGASRVLVVDDGTAGSTKLIDVALNGLTLTGGRAIGFNYGGGILNHENLTITAGAVTGNSANFFGGGIWTGFGNLTVTSSTISGNQASHGAGIFRGTSENTQTATITNSTISGNTATVSGGGILNMSDSAVIRHSTITANTAPNGGGSGVASYGSGSANTAIYSTIIAGNNGSDVDLFGGGGTNTFQSDGYNLIGTGNAIASFANNDQTGVTEPRLMPLANNGGPTRTHAFAAGSPAVDAGDPAAVPGTGGVPEFDQRGSGFARVFDGRIDIGAFESQVVVPTLAGDYNKNRTVDAADYVVWRKARGSTVPPFSGPDGDGSGIVDQADLAVWRANFGRSLAQAVAAEAAFVPLASAAAHEETSTAMDAERASAASTLRSNKASDRNSLAFSALWKHGLNTPAALNGVHRGAVPPRALFPMSNGDLLAAILDIENPARPRHASPADSTEVLDGYSNQSAVAIDLAFDQLGMNTRGW
jgi:CSLREA domain-containing protein